MTRDDIESSGAADDRPVRVASGETSRRDVIVPLRLYKTITVFSTLLAILFVVLGFTFFDGATWQGGVVMFLVRIPFPGLELTDGLRAVFAVLGVVSIAIGAAVYIIGTRFRTAGMGNGKTGADESTDDG